MSGYHFPAYVEVAPGRFRERYGLDFEDFQVGQVFKHRPGYTFTQQDNIDNCLDTLNQAMLHFDAHYAAQTEFKQNLIVTTLIVQKIIGMGWKTFCRRKRIAGWPRIAMKSPVYGGDTLYAESEIIETRADTDDPECGMLLVATRGFNQDQTLTCEMLYKSMTYKEESLPFQAQGY